MPRLCNTKLGRVSIAIAAGSFSAVQAAAQSRLDVQGDGVLGNLARDAERGLSLAARQLEQPMQSSLGLLPVVAALLLATILIWPARAWLLDRLAAFLQRSHRHTELAVFGKAFGSLVITTFCFLFAGLIVRTGIVLSISMLPEVTTLADSLLAAGVLSGYGLGIGRALRSPDAKELRPLQMPPGLGRTIAFYPLAAGAMLGFAAFIDQASRILSASNWSWGIAQGLLIASEFALIGRFLIHAGHARERQVSAMGPEAPIAAIFSLTAIVWAVLAVALIGLLLGYTRFSMTVLQELLWAALMLTGAWLTTRFLDAFVGRLLDSEKAAGRFATGVVGVKKSHLEQAALLLNALFSVVIWLIALVLVLGPLYGAGDNVVEKVQPAPLLGSLETLSLSPRTLLAAVAVLVGGVIVTRIVRAWLERRFLPSTNLDVGARTSIVTGFSYIGIIFALLAASSSLGLQLEKITLIASALTVGIGFGLQAIIQNFVSGVILLFERPIKVGDWVSVTGSEGRVRRMRVRATEVVSEDGSIAIIPNSAFISSTVLNRSGAMERASFDLVIKVSGCGSANAARDLLQNEVAACAAVRKLPAPEIFLKSLEEDSWTFRVRVQPVDDRSQARTTSELLFHLSSVSHDGARITVT